MNVEIGTKVAQFPEKEYINGIFVAVYLEHDMCLVLEDLYLKLVLEPGQVRLEQDEGLQARVLCVIQPKREKSWLKD
jgi:hypothetical protein